MPKSEREETLTALTSLILSSLLDELVLDAAIQSHHEIARSTTKCKVCNTNCNLVHVPTSLASAALAAPSRSGTPSSVGDVKGGSASNGTSTPTNIKPDGTLYLECISCNRQIASNRYAPHLGSCMGLSNSRRGAPRSGSTKAKPPSEAGRSASPSSEVGYISDDKSTGKGKGGGKSRRDDESEFSLKRKRPSSPQISPSKKNKPKASGSPISRVKAAPDIGGVPSNANSHFSPTTNSQSRVPSKLRDSSTASYIGNSSSSSRESSPEGASVPTPTSSSFTQSPNLVSRSINSARGRGRPFGTGPPKRPSPPRPPPTIHAPHFMDDEGDETGSSTDTSGTS